MALPGWNSLEDVRRIASNVEDWDARFLEPPRESFDNNSPRLRKDASESSASSPVKLEGMKKYVDVPVPALIIFALPHSQANWVNDSTCPKVREAAKAFSAVEVAFDFPPIAEPTDIGPICGHRVEIQFSRVWQVDSRPKHMSSRLTGRPARLKNTQDD
jgi:hypothetical protein